MHDIAYKRCKWRKVEQNYTYRVGLLNSGNVDLSDQINVWFALCIIDLTESLDAMSYMPGIYLPTVTLME